MKTPKPVVPLVLLLTCLTTLAARETVDEFYTRSIRINNSGMMVLGGWAVANMATGIIGWSRNEGQSKYFHQMNVMWNTVNLAIAGFSIYGNLHSDLTLLTTEEMISRQSKSQRLFLINAGLDVAYMGTGLALWAFSDRSVHYRDRWAGYGNSVMLQGAFLLAFDLTMFGIQRRHSLAWADRLSLGVMIDAWGLTANLTF